MTDSRRPASHPHGIGRADLLAVTGFAAVTFLVLVPVLVDPLRCIQSDIAFHCQGVHEVANEQIRIGRFPHWNPYGLAGVRLFADVHLALLYPGTVLFRIVPFAPACVATWFFHYWLLAVTTHLLGRTVIELSALSSAISSIVFAFGGFSLNHCIHLNFVYALPWLPLSIVAIHQYFVCGGRGAWIWWYVGVLSFTFMVLSGGTPILLFAEVAGLWVLLCLVIRDLLTGRRDRLIKIAGIALMGAAAISVSAAQVLPTLDLYQDSFRQSWESIRFYEGAIHWRTLIYQLFAPGLLGNPVLGSWAHVDHETSLFVGGTGLAFAALGCASYRRNGWTIPLLTLGLLSAVFSLGDTVALRSLNAVLPIVRMRQPSRYLCLLHLAIAMLAGIGVERWMRRDNDRGRAWQELVTLAIAIGVLGLSLSLVCWFREMPSEPADLGSWLASQPKQIQDRIGTSGVAGLLRMKSAPFGLWCGILLIFARTM